MLKKMYPPSDLSLHLPEGFPSGFFCGDRKEILIMVCPFPSIADEDKE